LELVDNLAKLELKAYQVNKELRVSKDRKVTLVRLDLWVQLAKRDTLAAQDLPAFRETREIPDQRVQLVLLGSKVLRDTLAMLDHGDRMAVLE
jgi:hypothetical protein